MGPGAVVNKAMEEVWSETMIAVRQTKGKEGLINSLLFHFLLSFLGHSVLASHKMFHTLSLFSYVVLFLLW